MTPPILINGVSYAWVNITAVWYSLPIIGITSISYENKKKLELNYGQGQYVVSEAEGNVGATAEFEIYLEEWQKIIAAAPNNDPLQLPRADIQICYGGSRITSKTDTICMARPANDPVQVKQDDGKIICKITLSTPLITHA